MLSIKINGNVITEMSRDTHDVDYKNSCTDLSVLCLHSLRIECSDVADCTVESVLGTVKTKYLIVEGIDMSKCPNLLDGISSVYSVKFLRCTLTSDVKLSCTDTLEQLSYVSCRGQYPVIKTSVLRSLYMIDCDLKRIPKWMCDYSTLEYINLYDNHLSEFPHSLLELPVLHTLTLYGNPLNKCVLGIPTSDRLTIYFDKDVYDTVSAHCDYWTWNSMGHYTITSNDCKGYSIDVIIDRIRQNIKTTDVDIMYVEQDSPVKNNSTVHVDTEQYVIRSVDVPYVLEEFSSIVSIEHC